MCFVDWLSYIQKCMCIFVTTLSNNMPLLMLCMLPHGLYSLLDLLNKLFLYLHCDYDFLTIPTQAFYKPILGWIT